MSKIVLRADVKGLGKRGDIVEVADGYARNYLLPRALGMAANSGSVAQAHAMRTARDLKDAKDRESSETVARTLVPMVIKITAKAKGNRLFGSVAEKDVVDAIKAQSGVVLERRTLQMAEHIKTTGTHTVPVRLHADVQFPVTVEIVPA